MQIHFTDQNLAEAAFMVLRGFVDEPLHYGDAACILPRIAPLTVPHILHVLRTWPKPVACVSLNHGGLLAIGLWTDEFETAHEENWRDSMREAVYRNRARAGEENGEPRVFVCSRTESIAMTLDEAIRFQKLYLFPLAGRGIRQLSDDPLATVLRAEHGATDADSCLVFTRLRNVPPMRQL